MGIVKAVCISEKKGTQKVNVGSAKFIEDFGIEKDAHAGKWHRQVSLLSYEKIEAFKEAGAPIHDGSFGENLVVSGFDFKTLPVGTKFRCNEVVLELTQVGKECHNGCEIYKIMGDCIMPREGVFTRVLHGGTISVGDTFEQVVDERKLSHFDEKGNAVMVDVTDKAETERTAVARGRILVSREVYEAVEAGTMKKGDVLGTARIAGIMATKRTSDLIPMCHPLMLTNVSVDFELFPEIPAIDAICTAKLTGRTGVEMEALTGVTTTLLTIYDMCKALDKGMKLTDIRLLKKTGGKSGNYENT